MTGKLSLGPVAQVSRTVRNIEQARDWYGTVLGLPHLYSFGKLAFFDCGGLRLFLSEAESPSATESILYFQVPDIQAAHAELTSRGLSFVAAPHRIHVHADGSEEWLAAFEDQEGRPLALLSRVTPQ